MKSRRWWITGPGMLAGEFSCARTGRIGFRGGTGFNGYFFDGTTGESDELSHARFLLDTDGKEEFGTLRTMTGNLATVDVVDLRAGGDVPLSRAPNWNLYRARFSPDDRWIVFLANTVPTPAGSMWPAFTECSKFRKQSGCRSRVKAEEWTSHGLRRIDA